jgi:K+-sensing histidine kinase KdpD
MACAPYVVALLGVVAATVLRALLDPYLESRHVFSWYYAAVALAVWYGGWKPAIAALVLGYAAADWFFVEPRRVWPEFEPAAHDIAALVTYLAVGLAIAACGEGVRRARGALQAVRDREFFARMSLRPSEVREVAEAVWRHRLSSKDLWPYLTGLNSSPGMLELARRWEGLNLSPKDLARRLEDLAQTEVSQEQETAPGLR